MPQMAPINWLFMFFMFTFIYILFNMINYFIYQPKINLTEKKNINKMNLSWKW